MFKKKYLLLILFFIIIFQILLYTNNTQKTSFRYFKWTLQEVSIGKLISISFFSGLFISTLLNNTITSNSFEKNASENVFNKKKIPFRTFEINKRDEKTLGEIFTFFILETILIGRALKINPFDQPAVELIKTETKKILY